MLILVHDPGVRWAGDMMVMGCRSRWGKCGAAARSLRAVHMWRGGSSLSGAGRGASADVGRRRAMSSCGLERLVAEFSQRVVAAFEEFAGDRQARALVPEPGGGLEVVVAVG